MTLSLDNIRDEFPFFNQKSGLIYFDNASTTQKPISVLNSINDQYITSNANVHRGVYKLAEESTYKFENSRESIADYIGATSKELIIFTNGATGSINLVANAWARNNLNQGDHILLSEMEHHSNIVPWQIISKELDIKIDFIPISDDGTLQLDNIDNLITNQTKLVSIVHQSNVLGTVNPIKEIINKAHNKGAKVLIDGAQSIAHQEINVTEIDCDFFVFSSHKIYGPTGLGILYCKKDCMDAMHPINGGGEMIREVTRSGFTFNDSPWKFEPGTPPISQVIGLNSAIDFIKSIGIDEILKYENKLTQFIEDEMLKINGMHIYGDRNFRGPCIAFNIDNIHSYDLTKFLSEMNIAIRSGHHCAQPLMQSLGIASSSRLSLAFYNTEKEVEVFIHSMKKSLKILR